MLDQIAPANIPPTWTQDRVELLRKMFADGFSHRQMGVELGVSRNAAIGKCTRLGLVGRSTVITVRHSLNGATTFRAPTAKPLSRQGDGGIVEKVRFGMQARKILADKDRGTTQRITNAHLRKSKSKSKAKTKRAKAESGPADFLNITFMELVDDRCKFPRGEGAGMRFCGQKALQDKPYCGGCFRIAYSPPATRRDNSPAPARFAAGPGAGLRAFSK